MSDLLYCEKCDAYKTRDEFNKNKEDGYYPNCRLCFRKQSAEYWADKKFKECLACGFMLPIRKYEKQDGVPFATSPNAMRPVLLKQPHNESAITFLRKLLQM